MKVFYGFRLFIIFCILKTSEHTSVIERKSTSIQVDPEDGGEYFKRLVFGGKILDKPEQLMFTAPYRLCDGGCNHTGRSNFIMTFPLYIGNKARKVVMTLLTLTTFDGDSSELPWDKWSWSMPQGPIEHFFRRAPTIPLKSPDSNCKCPPNQECTVDFEVDKNVADLLKLRGVLTDDNMNQYKEDVKKVERNIAAAKELRRRQNTEINDDCCCPPRNIMMPTFISDKKFDEIVERFDKKKEAPKNVLPHIRKLNDDS